jgi:hypothetical protein
MIEEKNGLIRELNNKLDYAKSIVKDNSALFDECKKYHDLWVTGKEDRYARLFISDIFTGVNLDIYLLEDDSMDDVNLFLDEIPYEVESVREYPEGEWIRYIFYVGFGTLHLIFNYGKSKHCKLVETGETKPIYKRVCV